MVVKNDPDKFRFPTLLLSERSSCCRWDQLVVFFRDRIGWGYCRSILHDDILFVKRLTFSSMVIAGRNRLCNISLHVPFFAPSHLVSSSLIFSVPPINSRNSDLGPHIRLFSTLPTTVRALEGFFVARRVLYNFCLSPTRFASNRAYRRYI